MSKNSEKTPSSLHAPPPEDPFEPLVVIDRLEVGPVRVEPQRLVAPYRVVKGNLEEATELIYRYEEPVFDPQEPDSRHLAALVAAQVALNYGLFCRTLLFRGPYDDTDRRLLREMAENTAREIYVKKFLEPNPFLTDKAPRPAPVKKEKYCQAILQFEDPAREAAREKWRLWTTDKGRHCILSSGGKESLLSFGLLNEMGREVHCFFVNESGRHWFTALNAYRHFKDRVPHTARIWVNSDRVFNWMLGRLPFVRQDHAAVRADEYPLRLWTVAVFLFGILPLVRKRGIGRILIGDEFDTSLRASFQGIRHYDGLYDQSIYFDTALSRYFMRKGWSVSQFSMLRPLSELLIQKVLWERYPDLQALQMSCHATHPSRGRIAPCGRCEKCRRIVGMLEAIGGDPRRCGYSDGQIASCLAEFAAKGAHQETAGVEQIRLMLLEKGRIEIDRRTGPGHRAHPEVLKLRFDSRRSPMNAIPLDLRRPLFGILLDHCNGAVTRSASAWKDFDPLNSPEIRSPYPFELDFAKEGRSADSTTAAAGCLWGELTWQEAAERLQQVDIALLPVGAVEQHGPHLPLDTDAFDAEYLARRVAMACSPPVPLVLPLIAYGVSYHHEDFAGTISISNDTLSRMVYEIGISAARNGVRKLVIINAHGGNSPALNFAAQMINRDARIFVCVDTGETSDVDIDQMIETPNDVHAGEIETSTSLAVRAGLVKMEKAVRTVPEFSSRYLDFTGKRSILWYAHTRKISSTGVMGDPTKASAAKGEQIWETMVAHLAALVEDLKNMTLEEIYHRRY
jgi:creatinine amidohydrolase/Fe(II)-dependent formamide hydrolase-like protein